MPHLEGCCSVLAGHSLFVKMEAREEQWYDHLECFLVGGTTVPHARFVSTILWPFDGWLSMMPTPSKPPSFVSQPVRNYLCPSASQPTQVHQDPYICEQHRSSGCMWISLCHLKTWSLWSHSYTFCRAIQILAGFKSIKWTHFKDLCVEVHWCACVCVVYFVFWF